MSIRLELPSHMEEQLRREAAVKGVDAGDLARDIIARHQRRTPRWALLNEKEEEQLRSLNAELSEEYWQRFNALQQRHRTLSEDERSEYLQLWLQAEAWNVRRLSLLAQMAMARRKPLAELMKALKIRQHPSARDNASGT